MSAARNLRLVVDSEAVGAKRRTEATEAADDRRAEAGLVKARATRARGREKARERLARAGRWSPELAVPLTLPDEADVRAWVLRLPAGVRQVLVRVAASLYVPRRTARPLPDVLRAERHSLGAANAFSQLSRSLHKDDVLRDELKPDEEHLLNAAANFALAALIPAIDEARSDRALQKLKPRLLQLARSHSRSGADSDSLREMLLTEALVAVGVGRNAAHKKMFARERMPRSEAVKLSRANAKASAPNKPRQR